MQQAPVTVQQDSVRTANVWVTAIIVVGVVTGLFALAWDELTWPMSARVGAYVLALASGALVGWVLSRPWFARRFIGRAEAESLAAMRIWICLVAAAVILFMPFNEFIHAPTAVRTSMGMMDVLYRLPIGLDLIVASPGLARSGQLLCAAMLVGCALGWRTKWVLPVAIILYLALGGVPRSYRKFFHFGLVPAYLLMMLWFLPCADAWSLDARRRVRRGLERVRAKHAHSIYAWGRFTLWMTIALFYTAGGMSKILGGGLTWGDAHNMRAILFQHGLRPQAEYIWLPLLLALPGWMFTVMGVETILTETGMILTVFSRWARRLLPIATAAMHLGITLLMDIHFWDLILLMAIFYNWRPLLRSSGISIAPDTTSGSASTGDDHPVKQSARIFKNPALLVTVLVTIMAVSWGLRLEWYPFTAVQMFSGYYQDDSISHTRLFEIRESGLERTATLRQQGLLRLGRSLAARAFAEYETRDRVKALLRSAGEEANRLKPVDPIQRLELRRYHFPLNGSPGDPYTEPVDQIVVELNARD